MLYRARASVDVKWSDVHFIVFLVGILLIELNGVLIQLIDVKFVCSLEIF